MVTKQTNTVIIGGGPSGLAVAACLGKAGVPYTLLEQHKRVANTWHQFYEAMHIHTDKSRSALPHFPFPADYPKYPSRNEMISYFNNYKEALKLNVEFGQRVIGISQNELWNVESETQKISCQHLVIATGRNGKAMLPPWASSFSGVKCHSSHYTSASDFSNQKVLVVGFGNSGHDIAADLYHAGAKVCLSVRQGINIVDREVVGIPIARIAMLAGLFPIPVADRLTLLLFRILHGDLRAYGILNASEGVFTQVKRGQIPVLNSGTVKLIKRGAIAVYPEVKRVDSTNIVFSNNKEETFDACIFATGYEVDNPKASFSLPSGPNLFFCGYITNATGVLREIGKEAMQISHVVAGRT